MAELGSDSIKEHKELLSIINKYPWKEVLLVGGDFLNLEHPYHSFTTAKDAGSWLKNNKIDNAFLLLKGSRSIQMEGVLDYL
jgi:UDP-N-acetylmuramoyl-tripeptide--D-alanyl-D-alanine ligase